MSCITSREDDAQASAEDQGTRLAQNNLEQPCLPIPALSSNTPHHPQGFVVETLEDHSAAFNNQPRLTFRVTGAASVSRLEPLLLGQDGESRQLKTWTRFLGSGGGGDAIDSDTRIDFVWETTVTKQRRQQHRNARVLNRLSGAQVLEDKANLALLQRLMTAPTLESYTVNGRSAVARWARRRFEHQRQSRDGSPPPRSARGAGLSHEEKTRRHEHALVQGAAATDTEATAVAAAAFRDGSPGGEDWWCVKAAGGNGGLDIWVLHKENWKSVTEALSKHESYVIQRYVARPMLWQGRKFHFRVYAALRADMSAWLYRTAYILSASRQYSLERNGSCIGGVVSGAEGSDARAADFVDEYMHISNLAVNKNTEGHPGQVPCDLPSEYPSLWPRMLELLRSLVEAATPFMQHQASPIHFEFLGLDIIADSAGGVWLMEANRLPGLQSSKQNLEKENEVYDGMMVDLIRFLILPPLTGCTPEQGRFEMAATPASSVTAPSTETWRNVMRFAAFKRSCMEKASPL